MKVIKKVVMYVAIDEEQVKDWTDDEDMPVDDIEREEWVKDQADTMLDMDIDGMLCENPRQYGATWRITDPTVEDMKSDEYKEVSEDC